MKREGLKKLGIALLFSLSLINMPGQRISAEDLPAFYDSREYGYITEKKSQNPYGTCWAFAAISAAEASLVKNGYEDNTIDLSEYHTAYYTYAGIKDPLGNADGDGTMLTDVSQILDIGGHPEWTGNLYSSWCGPVLEEAMPYEDAKVEKIPEEDLSTEAMYHLNKMIICNGKEDIKKAVMEYGAVAFSYYAKGGIYSNSKDYDELTYHLPNVTETNHCAAIVGWDDNYPKEHFNVQPDNDGAWIVKDNDGPTMNYKYISYETNAERAVAYVFEPAELLENNYQYTGFAAADEQCIEDLSGNSNVKCKSYMNIYSARRSEDKLEKLEAVMSYFNGVRKYQIQIYVNPVIKDGQIISYDYKSEMIPCSFEHRGVYKIDIEEDIYLNQGDTFAIEISGDVENYYIINTTSDGGKESIRPGESYSGISVKGEFSYVDLVNYNNTGNLDIKGFTNSTDIPLAGAVSIDKKEISLSAGEKESVTGSVDVSNGGLDGVVYTTSDPQVATVNQDGEIIAVSSGTAVIYVKAAYGNDVKECVVEVKDTPVTSIEVEEEMELIVGESKKLNAVVNDDATNKAVIFTSENSLIASADENGNISGIREGMTYVTVTASDGSGICAVCKITVSKPKEDSWHDIEPVNPESGTEVTSIFLTVEKDIIKVGEKLEIEAKVYPENAESDLEYLVSNIGTVSIDNGTILALKPGNVTITVIDKKTSICNVVHIYIKAADKIDSNITVEEGTTFIYKNLKYMVTSKNTVEVTGTKSKNIKKLTVPATVMYANKSYAVVEISKKAFYNCSSLRNVKIGKNVIGIGTSAFRKCSNLKKIVINSNTLKAVGKNAFKGIKKDATISVPSKKYNKYKNKLFKKSGLNKSAVWKEK